MWRVELPANPQPIVETKTIKLHAGEEQLLAFHITADSQNTVAQYTAEQNTAQQNTTAKSAPLPTSLTVHVPADAQVFLGGNPTTTTGTTRTYSDRASGRRTAEPLHDPRPARVRWQSPVSRADDHANGRRDAS